MDANRSLLVLQAIQRTEMTQDAVDVVANGSIYAQIAWREYHTFIEVAKRRSGGQYGMAHYFDIHGNTMSTFVVFDIANS